MTFHHSLPGSIFDPGFSSSYDERFHNFWFSPDHQRSFHSFPPYLGSVPSQNIDPNYCHILPKNVPYSSYSAGFCHQLPYAGHSLLPTRIPSNSWANVSNGEMSVSTSPEDCSRFLSNSVPNCYSVERNLTMPDAVPSFLQPDHDYHVGSNMQFSCDRNRRSSSDGFINYGCVIAGPSQHLTCQHPGYPLQNSELVNSRSGDFFSLSPSFFIDDIMRNTAASSSQLAADNRITLGSQSSLLDESCIRQPTFSHFSPARQAHAAEWNFEASGRAEVFDIVDYITANKSAAMNAESPIEIPSLSSTRQMVRESDVNDSAATSGQADCKFSASCMVASSVSLTQVSNHTKYPSPSAHQFVCRAVSELPMTSGEPVIFTPSTSAFDGQLQQGRLSGFALARRQLFSTQTESAYCDRVPVEHCVGMSSAVVGSTGLCESDQIAVNEVETRKSLAESDADAVAEVGISATSIAVHSENCQSQVCTSRETQLTCAVNSAPAISSSEAGVTSSSAAAGQKPTLEVMETREFETVTHDESDDALSDVSDDVIIVSPLPTEHEPTAPVTINTQAIVFKSNSYGRQPSCTVGKQTTGDAQLCSILRSNVPNSLFLSQSDVGSHAIRVTQGTNSPSVPLTSHSFNNFRNCELLSSRAKHVIGQNSTVQTANFKRLLPHHPNSYIPRTSQQQSANGETCSHTPQTSDHSPVTDVPSPIIAEHPYSEQLKQLLLFSQSFQKDKLPKPGTVRGSSHPGTLDNSQQSPVLQSVTSSLVANAVSTSQSICSTSSSRRSHVPPAVRPMPISANSETTAESYSRRIQRNQTANHCGLRSVLRFIVPKSVHVGRHAVRLFQIRQNQSHSQPVFKHSNSASQFHGMSSRKNGTYSVRAAHVLFQQLKQAKLWDYASARAARRQLLSRRLSMLPQNGDVIDLTAEDNDGKEDAVETCELIFARTRCRMMSLPNFRRLQQNFFRRSSVPNDSSCDAERQPHEKQTFAVDKSLPFYQCFVQKLLRNYRFTSAGTPITVYPEFRPQAPPSISCGSKNDRKPANSQTCEELIKKKQPVVLLEKLNLSLVSKSGTVNIKTMQSGVSAVAVSHVSEAADSCIHVTSANANYARYFAEEDTTAKETNWRDIVNVSAKLTASGRQSDELISSCHPVSVVLERLDKDKIRQICKELHKTNPCCQDKWQTTQLGTKSSVSDLSWTVIQVPHSNKLPKLIIRATTPSMQNTSQIKVVKKTRNCTTGRVKSALKRLRTRSCNIGIRHLRSLPPKSSQFSTSCKRTVRNKPVHRKLRFQSSVLMSLRSRNGAGHTPHRRHSTLAAKPPPRISPKCNRKQSKSLHKLLVKKAEIVNEIHSIPAECLCTPESLFTSVEQDVNWSTMDSPTENITLADFLPCNSVFNHNSPDNSMTSDSDTIELSPYTVMDVDTCDDQNLSLPEKTLSADVLPYNSVFNCDSPKNSISSNSDAETVELSPHAVMDLDTSDDQGLRLIPSDSIPENAVSADILPYDSSLMYTSSSVNTVELSPCFVKNVDQCFLTGVPRNSGVP